MHNFYVNSMLKWNDGMQHSQTAYGRAWRIKGLYTDGHPGSLPGAPCRCVNWTETEVVNSHPYYRQRCALVAWQIHMEHQAMNRDEGPYHHYSPSTSTCSLTVLHPTFSLYHTFNILCMWMHCCYSYFILYHHHCMVLDVLIIDFIASEFSLWWKHFCMAI